MRWTPLFFIATVAIGANACLVDFDAYDASGVPSATSAGGSDAGGMGGQATSGPGPGGGGGATTGGAGGVGGGTGGMNGSGGFGGTCGDPSDCQTDHCVDGHCCDDECAGECAACDVSGSEGTCSPVQAGTTCDANPNVSEECNGSGECLRVDGEDCQSDNQCLSGFCNPGPNKCQNM